MPLNRLLVVEDDVAFARLLLHWLRRLHYEVFHVTDLPAAINHVRTNTDLLGVLLDLRLPSAQDLEAIPALYAANPLLPLAVLSGRDDVSMTEITQLGARTYLHKNRVTPETLAALCTALRGDE